MARRDGSSAVRKNENVVSFVRPPAKAVGADALDLVYQAAEIFSGMERDARELETRALAMCKTAAERLKLAEQRSESAEQSLLEVVAEADRKLIDASRALTEVELRVTAAEEKAASAEVRAQVAETEAREAKQTLALVEDAIRRRLLCASPEASNKLTDVA